MPVQPIVLYPNPILKKVCQTADWHDPFHQQVCQDLVDTMQAGPGVGVAAPQIGHDLQICVVDVGLPNEKTKRPEGLPAPTYHGMLALFNPQIIKAFGNYRGREGCLSIPEFTANVSRNWSVEILATDRQGQKVQWTSHGFEAICLQHELDHLQGLLFLDRVTSLTDDLFLRKGMTPRFAIHEVK